MGGVGSGNRTEKRQEVLNLLANEALNFTEIGNRVGLTRERVRQIALRELGITAVQRRVFTAPSLPSHLAVELAVQLGLDVVSVIKTTGKIMARSVFISGHLCLLRTASWRNGYAVIHRPKIECDFCIYELPDGRLLILPEHALPVCSNTCFTIKERILPGGYIHRHEWKQYIDAWHLLGADMKILEPVQAEGLNSDKAKKWAPILERLDTLPANLALPIECENIQEAQQLQTYMFQRQNSKTFTGTRRYQCTRRKTTVYIILAQKEDTNGH